MMTMNCTMGRPANGQSREGQPSQQACCCETYVPGVDIIEQGDHFAIIADLPGVAAKDIEIEFDEGTVNVHARVQPRHSGPFLRREYGVGDFQRSFTVGKGIDDTQMTATLEHGVLTIKLPKGEAHRARKIAVQSGS